MTRPAISVLLPTYNCAAIVRDTLDSVKWADEILVVDSYSTDSTLDICREYTDRITQHEYINSAKQKNWAIPQCQYEWVLQIDTDEVAELGLKEEMEETLAKSTDECDGFLIPFKHHVLGQWVRVCNLYPEYHLRLFRRDVGRFEDKEVHAHVKVPGQVGVLTHHILHYGMPNISKQLRNLDRYTRYQADELHKRSKRFHWWHLVLRPTVIFARHFLWQQGFRAGYRGLLIAALNATFDFWAHAKLWELEELGLERSPGK